MSKEKTTNTIQKDQKETPYNVKLHMKASLIILIIGWVPMFAVMILGAYITGPVKFWIMAATGVIYLCVLVSMFSYIGNPAFWNSFEQVEQVREDYRIFKAKYQKALKEFVINQKLDEDGKS